MTDTGIRLKNPVHPGGFLRRKIMDPHGLNVTEGAVALGVSRQTLSDLVNEHADLSAAMALRFEKAFGVSMDTLMRMQSSYDIAQARSREGEITVKPYVPKEKKSDQPNLF